jgi:hypothetical protein
MTTCYSLSHTAENLSVSLSSPRHRSPLFPGFPEDPDPRFEKIMFFILLILNVFQQ